jgi:hypothetical protein
MTHGQTMVGKLVRFLRMTSIQWSSLCCLFSPEFLQVFLSFWVFICLDENFYNRISLKDGIFKFEFHKKKKKKNPSQICFGILNMRFLSIYISNIIHIPKVELSLYASHYEKWLSITTNITFMFATTIIIPLRLCITNLQVLSQFLSRKSFLINRKNYNLAPQTACYFAN